MWLSDAEVRREFLRLVDVHLYSYDSLFWLLDIIEIGDQLDLSETSSHELMLSLVADGLVVVGSETGGLTDLSFERATVITLTDKGLAFIGKPPAGEPVAPLITAIERFLSGALKGSVTMTAAGEQLLKRMRDEDLVLLETTIIGVPAEASYALKQRATPLHGQSLGIVEEATARELGRVGALVIAATALIPPLDRTQDKIPVGTQDVIVYDLFDR